MTDARLFCLALSLAVLLSLFAVPAYAASDVLDDGTSDSVTTDGYTVTGNGASTYSQKIRSINTWNPTTGGVEFEHILAHTARGHTAWVGLGQNPFAHSDPDAEPTAIEYAIHRSPGTRQVIVQESGTNKFRSSGAIASTSTFKITMDSSGTVRYYIDNVLLYTSSVTASGDYYLHATFKGSASITVQDTAPPTVTVPPDVTVDATGSLTAVALGTATATDIFDSNPTVTNDAPESFRWGRQQ